ncbi:MAG: hypothetical protein JWN97_753 [Nocardioides sp.]|nr:hypothetical protein [Nocardioides sp.]
MMSPAEKVLVVATAIVEAELDRLLEVAEGPNYVTMREQP